MLAEALKGQERSGIWSLYEMLQFYAEPFLQAFDALHNLESLLLERPSGWQKTVARGIGKLEEHCERIGLVNYSIIAKQIESYLRQDYDASLIVPVFHSLRLAIADELRLILFLQVDRQYSNYLFPEKPLFSQSVYDRFPSAIRDIEEAAKCIALESHNAAVVYLCAVIQCGIMTLAKHLGRSVDPERDDWNDIIQKIESGIAEKKRLLGGDWTKVEPFYAEIAQDARSLKNAWRNPTLHFRRWDYQPAEVLKIWERTRQFMETLVVSVTMA